MRHNTCLVIKTGVLFWQKTAKIRSPMAVCTTATILLQDGKGVGIRRKTFLQRQMAMGSSNCTEDRKLLRNIRGEIAREIWLNYTCRQQPVKSYSCGLWPIKKGFDHLGRSICLRASVFERRYKPHSDRYHQT